MEMEYKDPSRRGRYIVVIGVILAVVAGAAAFYLISTAQQQAGQAVSRLVPITLSIATATTTSEYVDIEGFAVFRVTSIDSNAIYGYAISGVYPDLRDSGLLRGQVARLVPWS